MAELPKPGIFEHWVAEHREKPPAGPLGMLAPSVKVVAEKHPAKLKLFNDLEERRIGLMEFMIAWERLSAKARA